MVGKDKAHVRIDLNQFKLHINIKPNSELTLHFNSPSRRFYISVIALVVHEMKKRGKITSVSLQEHQGLLALQRNGWRFGRIIKQGAFTAEDL
jgi:hypothetical protein